MIIFHAPCFSMKELVGTGVGEPVGALEGEWEGELVVGVWDGLLVLGVRDGALLGDGVGTTTHAQSTVSACSHA